MRAVAPESSSSATSVYIHFAERDALVLTALEAVPPPRPAGPSTGPRTATTDPAGRLRARVLLLGSWVQRRPGLYKVLRGRSQRRRPCRSNGARRAHPPAAVRHHRRRTRPGRRRRDGLAGPEGGGARGRVDAGQSSPTLPWPPLEEQVDQLPGPGSSTSPYRSVGRAPEQEPPPRRRQGSGGWVIVTVRHRRRSARSTACQETPRCDRFASRYRRPISTTWARLARPLARRRTGPAWSYGVPVGY